MGQSESHPSHYQLERRGDAFVLVSNEPEDCFLFNPAESYLVSYGINHQTHPKFAKKTLGSSTVADAREIMISLQAAGVIPKANASLYEASKDPDACTAAGMKRGFQEHARRVGPNGLFVFHFSGHGIRVQNDMWGLAPVDFDYTTETYLTADVLSSWLHEVDCRAQHILFTLDCCYAGGIGKELTASGRFDLVSGLYVLSACTANEASLVIGPLGHSVFTYCLSRAIAISVQQPGQLPLRKIFAECQTPSVAMSSLIVSYSPENGLKWGTMEPEFNFLDLRVRAVALQYMGEGPDQTDAAVGRFQYALSLYDQNKPIPYLDDKTVAWLETAAFEALTVLKEKRLLKERPVRLAVLCSMLYSIASIEMALNSAKMPNPNNFITSFMHTVATIDLVQHGVEFSQEHFLLGWQFYDEVVKQNLGKDDGLRRLYHQASKQWSSVGHNLHTHTTAEASTVGEDFTDSGQVSQH